jgi:glycosyltransferase involved in cell wall biosynthesis
MTQEIIINNSDGPDSIYLSVVIPVFNEEKVLPELLRRLIPVCESITHDYEIIFVDDGSRDNTFEVLKNYHDKNKQIHIVKFSRNFGQHTAVKAGLAKTQGKYVVTLDSDLQDKPEDIHLLLDNCIEGYEIVQAVSKVRNKTFMRNIFSKLFHRFFYEIIDVDIQPRLGLFRCMSRKAVDALLKMNESHIFLGGQVTWIGFNSKNIPVEREHRFAGKTHYSYKKQFYLMFNAMSSFSEKPLIWLLKFGLLIVLMSFFMLSYVVYKKLFFNVPIVGWTSLISSIFLSTGIIVTVLSFIGLYVSKIFLETKKRPHYIVEHDL